MSETIRIEPTLPEFFWINRPKILKKLLLQKLGWTGFVWILHGWPKIAFPKPGWAGKSIFPIRQNRPQIHKHFFSQKSDWAGSTRIVVKEWKLLQNIILTKFGLSWLNTTFFWGWALAGALAWALAGARLSPKKRGKLGFPRITVRMGSGWLTVARGGSGAKAHPLAARPGLKVPCSDQLSHACTCACTWGLKIELELNNLNSVLSRSTVTPIFPLPLAQAYHVRGRPVTRGADVVRGRVVTMLYRYRCRGWVIHLQQCLSQKTYKRNEDSRGGQTKTTNFLDFSVEEKERGHRKKRKRKI